jgi:ABC-type hemin transport system ATPase subunit
MKGVNYSLPGGGRRLVSDFAFEFLPGERLGIAGPNGAGKSTLLDLITGDCWCWARVQARQDIVRAKRTTQPFACVLIKYARARKPQSGVPGAFRP